MSDKEEWQDIFYTPINEDGSYGAIGHIRYQGKEKAENCGLISFDAFDMTIVGRVVIRCKDCKYWCEYDYTCRHHRTVGMTADDFCSRGVRKDG